MVMVYIVFLNASILGDGFKLAPDDPGRIALSAVASHPLEVPAANASPARAPLLSRLKI